LAVKALVLLADIGMCPTSVYVSYCVVYEVDLSIVDDAASCA